MELWQAIVLGLVEGITEYLPVSSTGHLILAASFMGLDRPDIKASVDAFNIVIQGGAILAVLGLYFRRVGQMINGLLGKDPDGFMLLINLIIAFIPAAVVGVLFDDLIERYLFYVGPVAAALIIGGVYMMLVDQWRAGRFGLPRQGRGEGEITELSMPKALFIGILQIAAMWPGTSRSMMTITGGMLVGLKPKAAAEFSFLLGVMTLSAATGYKLAKNLSGDGPNLFEQLGVGSVVVGMIAAAISAAIAVKWLVGFLNRHGLTPFGWYRIAVGLVLLGLGLSGYITIAPQ